MENPAAGSAEEDATAPVDSAAARRLVELEAAHAKALGDLRGAHAGLPIGQSLLGATESAAIAAERRRVEAAPADAGARLALARAYHHEGIHDLALEHYRAVQQLTPDDPEVHRDLGRLWLDQGAPGLALPFLHRAIRARSQDALAWSYRGVALDMLSRYPEAETAFRRAVTLEPRRWDFLNNLGWNLFLQGRFAEAAASFREGLALARAEPALANNLGLALAFQGDSQGALEAFALAGTEGEAWNNLGVIHRARGELEAAAAAFEEAARRDPGSRAIAGNLAALRRRMDRARGVVAEPVAVGARTGAGAARVPKVTAAAPAGSETPAALAGPTPTASGAPTPVILRRVTPPAGARALDAGPARP